MLHIRKYRHILYCYLYLFSFKYLSLLWNNISRSRRGASVYKSVYIVSTDVGQSHQNSSFLNKLGKLWQTAPVSQDQINKGSQWNRCTWNGYVEYFVAAIHNASLAWHITCTWHGVCNNRLLNIKGKWASFSWDQDW